MTRDTGQFSRTQSLLVTVFKAAVVSRLDRAVSEREKVGHSPWGLAV
jgi:hypothetical protein